MRVLGLLSWYDEKAEHLTELVFNLAENGVCHMVAVDGAYILYPDARAQSPIEQAEAIRDAASDARIGCTIHVPAVPWAGNELQKRTVQFALGHAIAEPNEDWFLILDADELISEAGDYRKILAGTPHDCATVLHCTNGTPDIVDRRFYRAQPTGIYVRGTHFRFMDGAGRMLKGPNACGADPVPMKVAHRPNDRTRERLIAREGYYQQRLLTNFEHELDGFPI